MSKNISNLSGRVGLKDNLFKKMSENVLNNSPKDIKEIAKEYNLGVSTIHGAESFYEFLRPSIILIFTFSLISSSVSSRLKTFFQKYLA